MKHLLRLSAFALFIALGAFTLVGLNPQSASAHDGEDHGESENASAQENNEESKSPYTYKAQTGDSYTKISRKAVQTYGINNDTNLSQAQIVAAETFLTNEAGSPALHAGESVSISEEAVKNAVEKAKNLDEAQQSRWERYVPFVNFNTDNVGESR